jgi:hypothetical protein
MQATGNCATQGVLEHSQGACLTGKVQLCFYQEGYCEPMSKGKVGNFSLVGKHLYIRGNQWTFPLTLALGGICNRDNWEFSHIAHREL